eukprot:9019501-Pyramimonas_sp.AAC.1
MILLLFLTAGGGGGAGAVSGPIGRCPLRTVPDGSHRCGLRRCHAGGGYTCNHRPGARVQGVWTLLRRNALLC